MSHFSKITAELKDLDVLKKAVTSMGFQFEENADCRYYYGTQHMDYVIKLPGKYDIAVSKEGDNYSLNADLWGNHVSNYVGNGAYLLIQNYTVEKIKAEACKENLSILSTEKQEEDVVLKIIDPETGGKIEAVCSQEGEIEWKTFGFTGTGCMKFQNLEKRLGTVNKTTYTSEYFAEEKTAGIERVSQILPEN